MSLRSPYRRRQQSEDTDRVVAYAKMYAGLLGIDNETAEEAEHATISEASRSQGHSLTNPATSDDLHLETKPVSPYLLLARDRKVRALVAFLRKTGISAVDVRGFSDYQWDLAAIGAKVNKPSTESRDQVVVELMRAEGVTVLGIIR